MEAAVYILGSCLVVAVLSLCVACAALAFKSGKSDETLARELSRMANRVVVEHGLQLDRIRKENELELGIDWNKSQREIARFRGTEPEKSRPDITVGEDT